MKLPYEQVAFEADKLILKIVTSSNSIHWRKVYYAFLEATGWNDASFDKETLNRIDKGWDDEESSLRNFCQTTN